MLMEWINVHDSYKPTQKEDVLLRGHFEGESKECIRVGFRVDDTWFLHDWKSTWLNFNSTHWMPLSGLLDIQKKFTVEECLLSVASN